MRNTILLLVAAALLAAPSALAEVTVSELGYHPEQVKRVVVYTGSSGGTFEVRSGATTVHTGNLDPARCQGGQPCLVGDFSGLAQTGTFRIHALGMQSEQFPISSNVFSDKAGIFPQFYDALRLQGSSYHPDHHRAADPPLTITQDGSFLMTTEMAYMTLARMGQAYESNPQFSSGLSPHIKEYVSYLEGLQDHDGTLAMPSGWYYNFGCPQNYNLGTGQHNDQRDGCLIWDGSTNSRTVAWALAGYAHALPALAHSDEARAAQVLDRAIRTEEHIRNNHGSTDDPGAYGSALFILHDFTGDQAYLERAYGLRGQVSTSLSTEWTQGNELYWHEYIKHRDKIEAIGTYAVNGQEPERFFADRAQSQWDRTDDIGDRAYPVDRREFHNTRPMLMAALHGEFARRYVDSSAGGQLSEAQLAWLTGQNRVDWQGEGMRSRSLIFGIGENGRNQHIRVVDDQFFNRGGTFLNGRTHIPGWTSGAYDATGDGVWDYRDGFHDWQFTEGTNHMTSLALLHMALLDAELNDRSALSRPFLEPSGGGDTDTGTGGAGDTGEDVGTGGGAATCHEHVRDVPATCTGGTITQDSGDSCRTIVCAGGGSSMQVLACHKGSGLEMYKQAQSGNAVQSICLGDACITNGQHDGFERKSYPVCTEDADGDTGGDGGDTGAGAGDGSGGGEDGGAGAGDGSDGDDPGDTGGQTGTCHEHVSEMPVSCHGGTITQDSGTGCRSIVCAGAGSSMQVLACQKDGHFEMYKQAQTGSAVQSICLGDACITNGQHDGFERSAPYPICTEGGDGGTGDGDDTGGSTGGSTDGPDGSGGTGAVTLTIKDWYPQGRNYVFVCAADYEATGYDWRFGDGHIWLNSGRGDVYKTYSSPGEYTVSCTAHGAATREDVLGITVT